MATGPGTNEYRGRPGLVPRHSRLTWRGRAAGARRRVGCGSSLALGPGVAPAADSKPGRRGRALTTAAVTAEKRRQEERRSPWPWELLSLDFESPRVCLMKRCLALWNLTLHEEARTVRPGVGAGLPLLPAPAAPARRPVARRPAEAQRRLLAPARRGAGARPAGAPRALAGHLRPLLPDAPERAAGPGP